MGIALTRVLRQRQLRTNMCECDTQPANISLMIVGKRSPLDLLKGA
jgi:hypothetical protein